MVWQGKIEFKKPITVNGKPHGVEHETTLPAWSVEDEGRVVHAEDTGKLWFATGAEWVELTPGGVGAHDHDDMYYTETEVDNMFSGYNGEKGVVNWTNVANKPTTFTPEAHTHDEYLEPSEVTYSLLDTQGLVGTGANQVAVGNHTHSGYAADGHSHNATDVNYDNSSSGLSATDLQAAVDELDGNFEALSFDADEIGYDNTTSGLSAVNTKTAIDELKVMIDGASSPSVTADNVSFTSAQGLTSTDVQAAIDEVQTNVASITVVTAASGISYDDTNTSLGQTDVQGAIEAIDTKVEGIQEDVFVLTAGTPVDTPVNGTHRFDESTNTLYVYNGTAWVSTVLS